MHWLLDSSTLLSIEKAYKSSASFNALFNASSSTTSRLLRVENGNANISISGVMTKSNNIIAQLIGGGNVTYSDIISAVEEAEKDPEVSKITLEIDSPGGQFEGLFDALDALQRTTKPVTAFVENVGASAAYAIASQADTIIAKNIATRIGSVGVVATIAINDDEVTITSTDAPYKRPDVRTEDGRDAVREELDAMHAIFVEAIADGRKTTVEKINDNYGRGATLLAEDALKSGMIDSIYSIDYTVSNAAIAAENKQNEVSLMDIKQLKTQHSDVYAAAVQEGVEKERDRVVAHLIMGEKSGAVETASEAIKSGSEMTATLQATYMSAGMNRQDVANRQEDNVSVSLDTETKSADVSEQVADLVAEKLGLEI